MSTSDPVPSVDPAGDTRRRRRFGWWAGAVAVAVVVAAFAAAHFAVPTRVETTILEDRDLQRTLVVVGYVRAPATAEPGTSVAGVVARVAVREGDGVKAGEILVQLEDREARAAVAQAEARLVEVTASARAQIEQAELEFAQADLDLARIRAVVAEGGLTRQRLEQAEQRAAEAQSRLSAARAGASATSPSAGVAVARAALEAARARLELTRIAAPSDGTVLRRMVEPGDAVQPGRALIRLATDGPAEVVAFPGEENLARLEAGAPARVSADAFPADTFTAIVALVAPAVDPAQGTIELRLAIPDPPAYLRPEMTLSVNVELERRAGARVLPVAAVRGLDTMEPWVGLVRDGYMERRVVELGLRGDDLVEILAGLETGERVVVGHEDLQPGTRVRLEE